MVVWFMVFNATFNIVQLHLQLSVKSMPITIEIVSSNPAHARGTRYNIM
jgi:hypothetical protein